MIDHARIRTDKSYRAGVKDTLEYAQKYLNMPQLLAAIDQIDSLDISLQKEKMIARQRESEDMEGTPVSC